MSNTRTEQRKRNRRWILAGIALFLAGYLYHADVVPGLGNVLAAKRIAAYATAVYPGASVGWYAPYDPAVGRYELTVRDESGREFAISCDIDGKIRDPEREETQQAEARLRSCLEEWNRADDTRYAAVYCRWRYDTPQQMELVLSVRLRETQDPFPETEDLLKEKLADAVLAAWEKLPEEDRPQVRRIVAVYRHEAASEEEREPYDGRVYSLRLRRSGEEALTREKILGQRLYNSQ